MGDILLSVLALIPSMFLFAGVGILFGSIVNEKGCKMSSTGYSFLIVGRMQSSHI